jgi:hypothetical protein
MDQNGDTRQAEKHGRSRFFPGGGGFSGGFASQPILVSPH